MSNTSGSVFDNELRAAGPNYCRTICGNRCIAVGCRKGAFNFRISISIDITVVINIQPFAVIRTPNKQAVFRQRIIRSLTVMSIKAFFIVNSMLSIRRRNSRTAAFAGLLFVFICQGRNALCQGALYERDQRIRRGAVRFFYLGVEQGVGVRQVLSLYGRGAEARRQHQGGQYGGGAPADAAVRALRTAVSQLGYDDVLMFYFTPYDFIYSIHT